MLAFALSKLTHEEALLAADEVVICNALMPVVPVRSYGERCWSSRELYSFLAPLCEQVKSS